MLQDHPTANLHTGGFSAALECICSLCSALRFWAKSGLLAKLPPAYLNLITVVIEFCDLSRAGDYAALHADNIIRNGRLEDPALWELLERVLDDGQIQWPTVKYGREREDEDSNRHVAFACVTHLYHKAS